MINIYLFSVLLVIACILLVVLFWRKQLIVGVFAGFFFLLLGVLSWNGISYVDYTVITVSGSVYNVSDHYTGMSNSVISKFTDSQIIGFVFVLWGLFLVLISAVMMFRENGRGQIDMGDEGGD